VVVAAVLLSVFWVWEATTPRYRGPVVAITGTLVVGLCVQPFGD